MKTIAQCRTFGVLIFAATFWALTPRPASGDTITFVGSGFNGSQPISASAIFTTDGSGGLTVTLTNTKIISGVVDPASVLTGVFFNLNGNPSLTKVSAYISTSSHIFDPAAALINQSTSPNPGTIGGTGNVGSEWGYGNGTSTTMTTQNQAIVSSGYTGMSFSSNAFDNNLADNLAGPPSGSFDGSQYGILGSDPSSVNGGSNNVPQIVNSVVFKFTGLNPSFNLQTGVTDIRFQYGTSLSEANFQGTVTPEPSSFVLGLTGLIGLSWTQIRRWARRNALALA